MGVPALKYGWSGGESFADLWKQIGGVPLERIALRPPPGMASELDVLAAEDQPLKRLYELVDGVLVEKAMGSHESLLAGWIASCLWVFVSEKDLGVVLGADGMLRLFSGQVRIPDVSFISWDRMPGGEMPDDPIWAIAPNLAVEVISEGNTKAEMRRKLRDYFFAGVEVAWFVYPETQTAEIYSSPTKKRRIRKDQALTAESVLPGFSLPLQVVFRRRKKL